MMDMLMGPAALLLLLFLVVLGGVMSRSGDGRPGRPG